MGGNLCRHQVGVEGRERGFLPLPVSAGGAAAHLSPVPLQNGNPSPFGNLTAQARTMQPSPAQPPLHSSQSNPRAQVPPPLLSPQVRLRLFVARYKDEAAIWRDNGRVSPFPLHKACCEMLARPPSLISAKRLSRYPVVF